MVFPPFQIDALFVNPFFLSFLAVTNFKALTFDFTYNQLFRELDGLFKNTDVLTKEKTIKLAACLIKENTPLKQSPSLVQQKKGSMRFPST